MSPGQQPTTWLVTGASRGIGLEIVRQLLASPDNVVIAACRNPENATTLNGLKNTARGTLHVIRLDVGNFDQVRAASRDLQAILGDTGLDYLINNAGVAKQDSAFTIDPEDLLTILRTNVAGPALIAQVCVPFLEKGRRKTILNVSSTAGSLANVDKQGDAGPVASYSVSKAALNMLTQKQRVERPDFIIITLCPGWVKTDMGGEKAKIDPDVSIRGILTVITSVTPADSGKYLSYNGKEIAW